jgi:predicted nucleic acid-binding protein
MLLVDTNVLIDLVDEEKQWYDWSAGQLRHLSSVHELLVNSVIYAELAPAFASSHSLDSKIQDLELSFQEIPREALFVAGVAHRHYRQTGGPRESILSDFFIGAHALVLGCGIITRDARRYRRYFPRVPLVTPS